MKKKREKPFFLLRQPSLPKGFYLNLTMSSMMTLAQDNQMISDSSGRFR